MGFEQGAISFRMYYLTRSLPADAIERFAARAAPPIDKVSIEQTAGWVTGRHLLDRNITNETAQYGGRMRLTLQQAERKVPPSLLHAEQTMEELAVMAAEGKPFLPRKVRIEIRKSVKARLLPNMPPHITGTTFIMDPSDRIFYADALPVKQSDAFVSHFQGAVGFPPLAMDASTSAIERKNVDIRDWQPMSFSPEVPRELMESTPGRDFLTWLWFVSEERGGTVSIASGEDIAVLIEGPLTFAHEGDGAHETILRRGEPVHSTEAKTALLSGKKLRQAKITLALGDELWPARFNADEFTFRSLRIPRIEEMLDAESLFMERMARLDLYRNYFLGIFDEFVAEREDSARWSNTIEEIHCWTKQRTGRR